MSSRFFSKEGNSLVFRNNGETLVLTPWNENALRVRSAMMSEIDSRLDAWVAHTGGLLRRYQRERYLFVFEEQYLTQFIEKKFDILDTVHQVKNPSGITASLSPRVDRRYI